ncbi:hypothetical protein MMF93_04555 [Streptomyces tubbatahanensis]|uniref:Integral membrane protein n=1 Tax=Streptomyces tubbatahanensis TaxID=2923272 RepID=A0ABY3XN52_9ACTN|nr:hypothetical protein [Streptomyces tubbatahanensis]UNS95844.1 hypothetical protein MMF93_04555 [Streptomyces tubbatahanensis]
MSGPVPRRLRRHPGAVVVGGWACLNAVLLGVLTAYGESELALLLWAGAFLVLVLACCAVLVSCSRGPLELTRYRVPSTGGAVVLLTACGLAVGGLMFVFGSWLVAVAGPLLLVAAVLALRRRSRGSV